MLLSCTGLGCAIPQDEFPEVYRFATSVFPSEDDDVITSPYNALLSLAELTEHADAVFPLENQALMDMCSLIQARSNQANNQPASLLSGPNTGTQVRHDGAIIKCCMYRYPARTWHVQKLDNAPICPCILQCPGTCCIALLMSKQPTSTCPPEMCSTLWLA